MSINNPPAAYVDPNTQYNLDELLNFGAKITIMTASSRAEQCQSLVKAQGESPEIGIQLHIMMGRVFSNACGDIPKILEGIAEITTSSQIDDQVKKLILIESAVLKQMDAEPKKTLPIGKKPKIGLNNLDPKIQPGAKKDESLLLREKLEAIRSMEKQIDESSEGN